jgi:hypothetical protein
MRRIATLVVAAACAASGCTGSAGTSNANSAASGAPAAAAVGEPAAAAAMITIPAGTTIPIVLDTAVGSATSRPEQPVRAHVARAVAVDGVTALPDGTAVRGVVTDATRSGKVKGRAHVALRFDAIEAASGERYDVKTSAVARTAEDSKDKDALEIAAPAIGGAVIGSLLGGGKGAAIGAAAGGGAGTAVVLSTRGKEVRIGAGTALTLKLLEPLTVKKPNL